MLCEKQRNLPKEAELPPVLFATAFTIVHAKNGRPVSTEEEAMVELRDVAQARDMRTVHCIYPAQYATDTPSMKSPCI